MAGDDIVRIEQEQIERFVALGLGPYEAIQAVEAGLDVQAVDALLAARRRAVAAVRAPAAGLHFRLQAG